jgi:hypothetical protein
MRIIDAEDPYETGPEEAAEYGLVGEPPPFRPGTPTGFTDKQQAAMYFARKHRRQRLGVVPGGPSLPAALYLSGPNQVTEGAAPGTVIGYLQVLNGSGTYTFTKTADPSAKFTLAAGALSTAGVWDYEVATFYPVEITANNGVDPPIVRTINVRIIGIPAPQLSNQAAVPISATQANISVTTDSANGTLYFVVTKSATPPTAAQVKLGQNDLGAAAIFAANLPITSTGNKVVTATPLVTATQYWAYFMHEVPPSEQSLVAASMPFTTP